MKGKLLVIEGPDGAGKSTLVRGLAGEIESRGIGIKTLREPGGTALSEQIRMLLKGLTAPDTAIDERAETLLFAAARAQLCRELIEPCLKRGEWVLLDRFEGSTIVYQGIARGLGKDDVRAVSRFSRGGLDPDRVLVLLVSPETSRKRLSDRDGDSPDRMEQATLGHLDEIIAGYRSLTEEDPATYRAVSGEGSPEEVLNRAIAATADLF